MPPTLAFGLHTFGDITRGADGALLHPAQVLRDVVEEAVLADTVGIDFFGVGEHHRDDFAISAPEVVLAAIAGRTSRIRLGSAVTVLGSDDPVRVFQRFATLDAVSHGRAEPIMGRGSFTESFPLFGIPLEAYGTVFEEKLELLVRLRREAPVTWSGRTRSPLAAQQVVPTTESAPLPVWVGVGGSPESVVRAARHGLPLMLAIIGGDPRRFAPYVELFHLATAEHGHPTLPVGVHSPGHIAPTDDEARETLWPAYERMINRIGAERGWAPIGRDSFEHEIARGSLYVGSPETVATRIAATVRGLGLARFDLKYAHGTLPHAALRRSIALYGQAVIPQVRALLAESGAPGAAAVPAAG
ncbi:MAG: LLM class flavin-dependent oxidoreductase [Gemmatimonadaceae bacterium]|jgi:probable LLM family oxidoreductase|nr:LLM class flavin-dependent oxidoreductase [Gemmatimonadaceae bacterium]